MQYKAHQLSSIMKEAVKINGVMKVIEILNLYNLICNGIISVNNDSCLCNPHGSSLHVNK
jgi:hypothetical protein